MKALMKNSKMGVTLVESVLAVVLLGFAVTGILTMLLASGTKIFQISGESSDYAEATLRMDQVIAAVSNGFESNQTVAEQLYSSAAPQGLAVETLNDFLGYDDDVDSGIYSLTARAEVYGDGLIKGWYLTLKYDTATVTGYASNTKGVFDS